MGMRVAWKQSDGVMVIKEVESIKIRPSMSDSNAYFVTLDGNVDALRNLTPEQAVASFNQLAFTFGALELTAPKIESDPPIPVLKPKSRSQAKRIAAQREDKK